MKKLVAMLALIALCCTMFTGAMADELSDAKSYLYLMYKNVPESTLADYEVVSVVNIGGTEYPIEWTVDNDAVKVIYNDNKMVTIDINDKNPEEVKYVLTATLKSGEETKSVSFKHTVPAALILEGMSYEEIVAAAYTLEDGVSMTEIQRLYGTVVSIDSEWSDKYGNITVTIQIGDLADQKIQCYRLAGEGAEKLAVGDKITVEGTLKNYKGTIEFDQGCVLVGYGEHVSQEAILNAAYKLEDGVSLTAPTVLRGVIASIDSEWSEKYGNITVTIVCDGKTEQPIQCYRLAGEGAATLAVGDEIAVAGIIKNYKGTIEFDQGCLLVPVDAANDARIAVGAYALEDGAAQTSAKTLTGVISSIDSEWSDKYGNITVTIVVGGLENYKIQCYRLAGEGADKLAVGDTITVNGILKNYKGTIEFDQGCTLVAVVK